MLSKPRYENTSIGDGNVTRHFYGSFFETVFSVVPYSLSIHDNDDDFVRGLYDLHRREIPYKEATPLIGPAFYNPPARGKENVAFLRGIWIDKDVGALTPDSLAALFPSYRIIVFNTFRSTVEAPRWRAYIPTTRTLGKLLYEEITKGIRKSVEAEGYSSKKGDPDYHGLDSSGELTSSFFYLPSQAEHKEASFFIDYNGPERGPLDPVEWIAEHFREQKDQSSDPAGEIIKPHPQFILTRPSPWKAPMMEEAVARWRERGSIPGQGNDRFFDLGKELAKAGLSPTEVEEILCRECEFANTPKDRRAQVPGIISWLREEGWFSS